MECSASSMCRNHMSSENSAESPSRLANERETSTGSRTMRIAAGSMSDASSVLSQNGISRHMRGSFTTNIGADPNSAAMSLVNSLVNGTAAGEALSGVHASHDVPAACRTRSWNSRIGSDSQYPSGFHSLGGLRVLGASRLVGR